MKNWIKTHKIWIIILVLSSLWILYIGYTDLWQPYEMIDRTINAVEKTTETFTFDRITKIIHILIPLLVPIFTYRYKHRLDSNVKKIVREKMKIGDKRKKSKTPKVERRKVTKKVKK